MSERIYHNLESVHKILPEVKGIMKKLMHLHRSLEILDGIDIENEEEDNNLDLTINELNMDFHKNMFYYYYYLRKLSVLGAYVKDLDMGLVDFYTKSQGKDILLCWMYGEEKVAHWHPLDSGFDERQHIDILKKAKTRRK